MESQEFKSDFEKLKFLLNLVRELNLYRRNILIIQKLQEVAAYAHFFGYCFEHWQQTGLWRKYPYWETDKTETDKTFFKYCNFCGEPFSTNKVTQRFCADKAKNCKNSHHNAHKKYD